MWLMASAAGSSKAALVSSICCRFVCKSLPATQQPNIVQCSVDIGGVDGVICLFVWFLFHAFLVCSCQHPNIPARHFHP
jgi:hypothetical protein